MSDRFSLKNCSHIRFGVFCQQQKFELRLYKNIASFREISFCDLRWENHCACLFQGKPGFQRAFTPTGQCMLPSYSGIWRKIMTLQRLYGPAIIRQHVFFRFQTQTQSSYCKNSSGTYLECGVLFQRAAILFLCSRGFLSLLAWFCARVMLTNVLGSARASLKLAQYKKL